MPVKNITSSLLLKKQWSYGLISIYYAKWKKEKKNLHLHKKSFKLKARTAVTWVLRTQLQAQVSGCTLSQSNPPVQVLPASNLSRAVLSWGDNRRRCSQHSIKMPLFYFYLQVQNNTSHSLTATLTFKWQSFSLLQSDSLPHDKVKVYQIQIITI